MAPAQSEALKVRLNSIGYLPDAEKVASIAAPCTNFTVVHLPDLQVMFAGVAAGPRTNTDTGELLYTADFSSLSRPGEYRLHVPGAGDSAPFKIGGDVYREPYTVTMLAMYLWRCGTAVGASYHGQTFAHAACHTNDAWLDFVGGGHARKESTGGWHDAGDYNKYVVNAGATLGVLFRAWEDFGPKLRGIRLNVPESGGPWPDFLAELKWEMDWLLTMQTAEGSVYHKISTRRFGPFIVPEAETEERYFTPWSSEATADFVAMAAQAARVFQAYDSNYAARCLQAAQLSYGFLKGHPEYHPSIQTNIWTGTYQVLAKDIRSDGPPHNRLWAAAELWETTGSPEALQDLEAEIKSVKGAVDFDFDWQDLKNLGLLTYVLSGRSGRDAALVEQVKVNLVATADRMARTAQGHGYARPLGTVYYWGDNGGVARQVLILMAADRLQSSPAYRATSLDALNYLFGRNSYGRSFVTGLGFEPPLHPHDRRSGTHPVGDPWPGCMVGGPHPKATDWLDAQNDARVNEIAINWNAALIYALAAFVDQ